MKASEGTLLKGKKDRRTNYVTYSSITYTVPESLNDVHTPFGYDPNTCVGDFSLYMSAQIRATFSCNPIVVRDKLQAITTGNI